MANSQHERKGKERKSWWGLEPELSRAQKAGGRKRGRRQRGSKQDKHRGKEDGMSHRFFPGCGDPPKHTKQVFFPGLGSRIVHTDEEEKAIMFSWPKAKGSKRG